MTKLDRVFVAALTLLGPVAVADPQTSPPGPNDPSHFAGGSVHIMSSSHQDIAWMDDPAACRDFRADSCISPALALMKAKKDYAFVMENMLNLVEYLESHPGRRDELHALCREGRLEWGATFNQPYEGLLSGEQLVRETYLGRRWFKKAFPGCDAVVAFNPDVPGRSLQMQQILSKAGIPYLVISRFHEGLWRWSSPDGSAVVAFSPGHYGNAEAIFKAKPEEAVRRLASALHEAEPAYGKAARPPAFPLLHSQDFSKPTDFDELIGLWNVRGPSVPRLGYSSVRGFFEAATRGGPTLPSVAGERPGLWLYIHGPTHHWAVTAKREAGVLLPAAEMFQTIRALVDGSFRDYPAQELAQAWLDSIYDDHGWGGLDGHITDIVFKQRAEAARDRSRSLLDAAQRQIAAHVRGGENRGQRIVVFNDLAWPRTDVVRLALESRPSGPVRLVDAEGQDVPFQLIDTEAEVNVAAAARGSRATASSAAAPDNGAQKAIDGRFFVREPNRNLSGSDRWVSAPGAPGPHWLAVDFGQRRTIRRVVVKHEGVIGAFEEEEKWNTAGYRLQAADSAEGPWRDLVPPVSGNRAPLTQHDIEPQTFRHLRLRIDDPGWADEVARIYELEAYAMLPPEAPTIVFVAPQVPAVGYRSFYLTSAAPTAAPQRSRPPTNPTRHETSFYRIELAPGGLRSVYDKERRAELLRTDKFLGGEVFTLQSVGNGAGEFGRVQQPTMEGFDKLSAHGSPWAVSEGESGPIQTVFTNETRLPTLTVRQKLVVYETLRRIDLDLTLVGWTGAKYREWRLAFPIAGENASVDYAVPMGIVRVGQDEIPMTGGPAYGTLDYDEMARDIRPREVQEFIGVSGAHSGVTLSSDVAVFDFRDPTDAPASDPVIQPVLLASRKSCHGKGNWYLQPGDHEYHISFFSHGPGARSAWRSGVAARHPLRPVVSSGPRSESPLPAEMSFFSLASANASLTALKKAEDDDRVVVRIVDMEGRDSELFLRSAFAVAGAEATNLIEEQGKTVASQPSGIAIRLGHHAIETLALTLGGL